MTKVTKTRGIDGRWEATNPRIYRMNSSTFPLSLIPLLVAEDLVNYVPHCSAVVESIERFRVTIAVVVSVQRVGEEGAILCS